MSGHQAGRPSPSNRKASFTAQTPGWPHGPSTPGASNLKRSRTPSGSEASSNPSEPTDRRSSPRLPLRRICMGRPYNSKCVETSHLAKGPKVARKPTCRGNPHCLLCTDRPLGPSNPTFLDQLIKGISYLDRSTNAFYGNYPKSILPRLAANYLERAANSIPLDHPDHASARSCCTASSRAASFGCPCGGTCVVPPGRPVNAMQYVDNSANTSCLRGFQSRNLTPILHQRPGIKLPELPLFGNGIFSLGRLPKFWEAIRSGCRAPEPISKPSSWW
ncbi:uncharacterized protein [Muntiacus reevesi]|uniref:uncharacterized protein n=1 Tax=Muntiacus reevesi TaxID=9886 RepID=UPI003306BB6D